MCGRYYFTRVSEDEKLDAVIMFNYVERYFCAYLAASPLRNTDNSYNSPQTKAILDSVKLPVLVRGTRLHAGILIAVIALIFFYILIWRTTAGYKMRVVGLNRNAAEYAGLNVKRNGVLAMFLAGGFSYVQCRDSSHETILPMLDKECVTKGIHLCFSGRKGIDFSAFERYAKAAEENGLQQSVQADDAPFGAVCDIIENRSVKRIDNLSPDNLTEDFIGILSEKQIFCTINIGRATLPGTAERIMQLSKHHVKWSILNPCPENRRHILQEYAFAMTKHGLSENLIAESMMHGLEYARSAQIPKSEL